MTCDYYMLHTVTYWTNNLQTISIQHHVSLVFNTQRLDGMRSEDYCIAVVRLAELAQTLLFFHQNCQSITMNNIVRNIEMIDASHTQMIFILDIVKYIFLDRAALRKLVSDRPSVRPSEWCRMKYIAHCIFDDLSYFTGITCSYFLMIGGAHERTEWIIHGQTLSSKFMWWATISHKKQLSCTAVPLKYAWPEALHI